MFKPKTLILVGILAIGGFFPCLAYPDPPTRNLDTSSPTTYALINGQWFTGQTFLRKTVFSVNGIFTHSRPAVVQETIDLENGFVIPPFGEAHTHNVEGPWNIDHVIHRYLQDGIFYVKNPNDISEFVESIRHKLNRPESIDAVFAHAGLTGKNGHPIGLYQDFLRVHRYEPVVGKREKGWFNGRAYFSISSPKDLEDQWPSIMAAKPDFLKIYLGDSEQVGTNNETPTHGFRNGLDSRLVPLIVEIAHRHGLRVSAHVETAADFRHAIRGGVDEIAHLPGWFLPSPSDYPSATLTPEDAQLAAHHHVVVVTTTVANRFHPPGHVHPSHKKPSLTSSASGGHNRQQEQIDPNTAGKLQAKNLKLLHLAGVNIAIGSDHAETALDEALHLHQLGVFDNLTLLKMWCETTPQTIFPTRKIGLLEEGYEASFLVLRENPLEDFRHVRNITFRFKQGFPLGNLTK